MRIAPWSKEGSWFKGNLHIHTNESDGSLSLPETLAQYRAAAYDFVAITDHDILSRAWDFAPSGLLCLPGIEMNAGPSSCGGVFHVLGVGVSRDFPDGAAPTPQEAVDAIRAAGGEAIVAHPRWSGVELAELLPLRGHLGMEVFNSSCEFSIGKGGSDQLWDSLLARGVPALGFANDDCHNHFNDHRPNDAVFAWNMVKAESLDQASIMAALRAGDFYFSCGPEIRDLRLEDGVLSLECSPVESVCFHAEPGRGLGERFASLDGRALKGASFKARGSEKYLRAELTDFQGRKAWSNPIFMKPVS